MLWGVISDIHSNLEALEAVLKVLGQQSVQGYVCCGDIVGYGPQPNEVIALLGARYVALKVDQDARPDLSRRYDEYGWPATVVFAPDGTEIVKRRGYIPPERMVRLLEAIVADPSPLKYLDQASIETYSDTHLLALSVAEYSFAPARQVAAGRSPWPAAWPTGIHAW